MTSRFHAAFRPAGCGENQFGEAIADAATACAEGAPGDRVLRAGAGLDGSLSEVAVLDPAVVPAEDISDLESHRRRR